MNLSIIGGAGYVGLVTAIGFARLGHTVTAIDIDQQKIASLQEGHCPIYEEGLQDALRQGMDTGRLHFAANEWDRVGEADLVFVTVGSPALLDGQADLSQIESVAERLSVALDDYTVIAIKSTFPLDALQLMQNALDQCHKQGVTYDLVVNPEFLREGHGLHDFFHPTRLIVGTESERARQVMRKVYAPFTGHETNDGQGVAMARQVPLLETNPVNALLIKYAANAFLATRISFINEVAEVCEQVGADILQVIQGIGYDPRIGHEYLQAGIGFGGPCLEKDMKAFIQFSQMRDYEPHLFQAVLERNDQQVQKVVERTSEILGGDLRGKRIAVFGLAFKAGTDDVRGSLPLRIVEKLMADGADVRSHDPVAIPQARDLLPQATYCEDPYDAVQDAEALLLVTDWPEYQRLSYEKIADTMCTPNILDGRNALDTDKMTGLGFKIWNIGRLT